MVELPVRIGGTTDSPSFAPDVRELAKRAQKGAEEELRKRAEKELGDAIFGKRQRDDEGDEEAEDDDPRDLLEKGLGGFLRR